MDQNELKWFEEYEPEPIKKPSEDVRRLCEEFQTIIPEFRPKIEYAFDCLRGKDVFDAGDYVTTVMTTEMTYKAFNAFSILHEELKRFYVLLDIDNQTLPSYICLKDLDNLQGIRANYEDYKMQIDFDRKIAAEQCPGTGRQCRIKRALSLKDYIRADNPDEIIAKLQHVPAMKNKLAGAIIFVMMEAGLIRPIMDGDKSEIYRALNDVCGDIGSRQAVTKYIDKRRLSDADINAAKRAIGIA